MYASTFYTLLSKVLPSLTEAEEKDCCDKKKPEETKKGGVGDTMCSDIRGVWVT